MVGHVLIADDVATNRIILKVKLASARYEVLQAADTFELHRLAESALPDLIILDHDLPGDAIAACRALKANPDTAIIPIIVVGAGLARQNRLAAFRAGADEVLPKHVDETVLLSLIRNLIRTRTTHDELIRRQDAAADLGFADAPQTFARRARIALIAHSRETGFAWRIGLRQFLTAQIEVATKAEVLEMPQTNQVPDVFVISAELVESGDGLRLVSELRSRPETRFAIILIHAETGRADTASMALDLGANAVLTGCFDAEELAARLKALVLRKFRTDDLRQALDQHLRLAVRDPLTGLFNRRYAQGYLARLAKSSRAAGRPFTLMLLDLDRFKSVNDSFGHSAGDKVLAETARRLGDNLREGDLLARIGGEEFLVALPDAGPEQAGKMAERLRAVIGDRRIRISKSLEIPVTLSIGVVVSASGKDREESVEHLIERADRALYASKTDGRNLVTFVRPAA